MTKIYLIVEDAKYSDDVYNVCAFTNEDDADEYCKKRGKPITTKNGKTFISTRFMYQEIELFTKIDENNLKL